MTFETEDLPEPPDQPRSSARTRGSTATADSMRTLVVIFGIALVVFVLDQLAKVWAQTSLVAGAAPKPLVGDLVQLRLIYNSGAALSIGSGATWLLTALSAGVVVFIVVQARRIRSTAWAIALGLVLGGALGNLADRLLRDPGFPNGHVVDFIDYGPFIGNVADIAIVGAAAVIGFLAVRGVGPDGRRAGDTVNAAAESAAESAADPLDSTDTTVEEAPSEPSSADSASSDS